MADQHRTDDDGEGRDAAAARPEPVPRDMPDQQAQHTADRWDAHRTDGVSGDDEEAPDDEELPDTDESGTGKRGAARSGAVHPEHPVPDEPSA